MAQFLKPSNLNNVWASGGDRIYPGDTKYATGWQVEVPPRQYFNEIDYKQDQMLAHLNQHGIPVWDNETEYQAGKSYIQAGDGTIYKAIQTNTGNDPLLDGANIYWKVVPADVATSAQAQALTDNTKLLTPFTLAEAFKGGNQNLSNNGFVKLPGGLILQWGSSTAGISSEGLVPAVTFVTAFPNACINVQAIGRNLTASISKDLDLQLVSRSRTQFQLYANNVTGTQSLDGFDWLAFGY